MKKYLSVVFLFMLILLASCSNSSTTVKTRAKDDLSKDVINNYNLIGNDNGIEYRNLNEVEEGSKNYYQLKVASNMSDTLFVYNYDVTSLVKKHTNKLKIKPSMQSFTSLIYLSEYTEVINMLDDNEEVKELLDSLGKEFALPETKSNYSGIKADAAVLAEKKLNSTVYFTQVYLPVYVERVYNTNKVLQSYIFVPVFAGYTINNAGTTYNLITGDNDSYKLNEITINFTVKTPEFVGNLFSTGNEKTETDATPSAQGSTEGAALSTSIVA